MDTETELKIRRGLREYLGEGTTVFVSTQRVKTMEEADRVLVLDDGKVEPGMVVTCTINGMERTFLLGSREASEGLELDVYSERSPLGEAVNGRMVGETTSYTAPNGKAFEVEILEVKPFRG